MRPQDMTALVLCGGRGTRAYPHTVEVPKPLLDVAGHPILEHVMDIYARQGVRRFVLAAGYKSAMISDFVASLVADWQVEVVDTGESTGTGARIRACRDRLGDPFFATYADGVADVHLAELLAFHARSPAAATITTVPLPSQYGTVDIDGSGRVTGFREKPLLRDHWINGGFFVMDRRVFDSWSGEDLEKEVLPALAQRGDLAAYRHRGFWKSMDTYKDALDLAALARRGTPPWLRPPATGSRDEPSGQPVGARRV